jgi:hypothetical protein
VDVASSNLVVRSQDTVTAKVLRNRRLHGGLAERRGSGLQSRIHGFESRTHLGENHGFRITSGWTWAIGAAVARFPDTEEVTGSIPVSPTKQGNLLQAVRPAPAGTYSIFADVAQLVEHHLAKVDVASSNLVVRSQDTVTVRFFGILSTRWVGREARQRPAKPLTRVRIPYPPR